MPLPLEAQLVGQMRRGDGGALGRRLRGSTSRCRSPTATATATPTRAALSAQWAANTAYVYRLAEGLVKETIARVASKASNGKVDARDLKTEDLELIEMYRRRRRRGGRCLVLRTSADAPAVATRAVVLNRPLAKGMDENLARLILGDAPKGAAARYDDAFVQEFVRAFEGEAAVYRRPARAGGGRHADPRDRGCRTRWRWRQARGSSRAASRPSSTASSAARSRRSTCAGSSDDTPSSAPPTAAGRLSRARGRSR